MRSKFGKIDTNGVELEEHEKETVAYFLKLGHDVELIKPTYTPKIRNPDIMMNGIIWEMKSPQGKSKRTVERIFNRGAHQSQNLIIDLRRRSAQNLEKDIKDLENRFHKSSRIKRLYIITHNGKLLSYKKK